MSLHKKKLEKINISTAETLKSQSLENIENQLPNHLKEILNNIQSTVNTMNIKIDDLIKKDNEVHKNLKP
jgi:hypothetical protein